MNICIDARMIESSGIGTYIQNLCSSINDYGIVLGDENTIKKYYNPAQVLEFNAPIYGPKEQVKFPYRELSKLRPDVLHVPHYNIPLVYTGKMVTTIHDITHVVFPQYLPNKLALYYAKLMISAAIRKSKHILTVSQNTKNDLVRYFSADPEKITVTYNGVNSKYHIKEKSSYEYLYEKYSISRNKNIILYVGNKKPHKNLERLLYAFAESKCRKDSLLIFTGKGFDSYTVLEKTAKELNLEDQIIHTGLVPESELVDLYNLADLFVFPSLYEGFGIPPLEAMACCTPVLCSSASSLPEVVGDAAYIVDPYDVKSITEGIDLLLENERLRSGLIIKGLQRVRFFTWEECAKKTKEVYEKVVNTTAKNY